MMPKIKICGITRECEVDYLVEAKVDYAGMVMYFPKSKRNLEVKKAGEIIEEFRNKAPHIKLVAVTVSPDEGQAEVINNMGFDYIQVHGNLEQCVYEKIKLPIIRAVNVDGKVDINLSDLDKIKILGVDGKIPGNGQCFDWSLVSNMDRMGRKLMLAGGLDYTNVAKAIKLVKPDIVDVSSAVEYSKKMQDEKTGESLEEFPEEFPEEFQGKDPKKIREFVAAVREL